MEYKGVSLSDSIYEKITRDIRKSYPNSCILYIDEIINPELLEKFNQRKKTIEDMRGIDNVSILSLFHGTKSHAINSISENGFLTHLNKTAAYGMGTYFSTLANYSKDYTDKDRDQVSYIFVCDVIVGTCELGTNQKVIIGDNGVNNLKNPSIYVTPYDDGAYPRYLVAFHKNAK